jgi:sulfur relay (sulfurtransferase) DsrF/TusC family protein
MPSLLCLVLDHGPYGSINPAEAIRHAMGALGKGWGAVLAFMGDSVYMLLPGQSAPAGEWLSLSEAVAGFVRAGDGRAQILADRLSLDSRGLAAADLMPGARFVSREEIASAMIECDRVLLF